MTVEDDGDGRDVDIREDLEEAVDRLGVPDGEGTPAGEASAGPEYHLSRAKKHAERALEALDLEGGPVTLDVADDVVLYAHGDEVRLEGDVSRLDRSEALLLGYCLEVVSRADSPSRPAVTSFRGP